MPRSFAVLKAPAEEWPNLLPSERRYVATLLARVEWLERVTEERSGLPGNRPRRAELDSLRWALDILREVEGLPPA